jgi:hypothetical protein
MTDLTIEWIQDEVRKGEYIITLHGDNERRNDRLDVAELEEALLNGSIIEDYPDDKRGHSCLVLGRSGSRNAHVVYGRNSSGWLVIITVYLPGPPKWVTPARRSKSNETL